LQYVSSSIPKTLTRFDSRNRPTNHFAEDGFYSDNNPEKGGEQPIPTDGPRQKAKVLVKIPQTVIQNCIGLAIFSTVRAGYFVSGAGGSGVLIARLPDGSWSPPSGILVHTLGVGFNAGIDIYDCVIVINNYKALEAFSKLRVTLGTEVSVTAGPVGIGGSLDADIDPRKDRYRKPVLSYMKSRGLYAGVQIDGTFIIERRDENARYYGESIPVRGILAGQVQNVPAGTKLLMEVIKSAGGRTNANQGAVSEDSEQSTPGNMDFKKYVEATEHQEVYEASNHSEDEKHAEAMLQKEDLKEPQDIEDTKAMEVSEKHREAFGN
jgi:lipid-binding SYLF domain-containing protein